ncbi:MAG: translin family protein [Candidatus Thorarchaeota archaeon]
MKLSEILRPLREEIDDDDAVREKTLPLARRAVRMCSEAIKLVHRKQFDEAKSLIHEASKTVEQTRSEMSKSGYVAKSRNLDVAYQELAEASNLLSLLEKGEFTPPEVHSVPIRSYLTGLADTVGELRRASLDLLRNDGLEQAEKLLTFMEEILEELQTFDYPNALVPDLRRKCDVARGIIERTRGDLTRAVGQNKLISRLEGLDEKFKD